LALEDFAFCSGLAYSSALDIWHDRVQRIDKKTLSRVSKALEVRPGELFADEDEQAGDEKVEPALAA
jgi:DNA-binding Xre family transcriptional regulator